MGSSANSLSCPVWIERASISTSAAVAYDSSGVFNPSLSAMSHALWGCERGSHMGGKSMGGKSMSMENPRGGSPSRLSQMPGSPGAPRDKRGTNVPAGGGSSIFAVIDDTRVQIDASGRVGGEPVPSQPPAMAGLSMAAFASSHFAPTGKPGDKLGDGGGLSLSAPSSPASFALPGSGMFNKLVSVPLLEHSKTVLPRPLLKKLALSPTMSASACKISKYVLSYMGDRKSKHDAHELAVKLLLAGISEVDMRDEIFCQVVKQMTANPSRVSFYRGWRLLALCAGTFPPSESLSQFLEAHLWNEMGAAPAAQQAVEAAAAAVAAATAAVAAASNGSSRSRGVEDGGVRSMSLAELRQAVPGRATWAAFCLARLRKAMVCGARVSVPSTQEMTAVEKVSSLQVPFYLPNGRTVTLPVPASASVAEAAELVSTSLGLPDGGSRYGLILWGEAGGVPGGRMLKATTYVLDALMGTSGDLHLHGASQKKLPTAPVTSATNSGPSTANGTSSSASSSSSSSSSTPSKLSRMNEANAEDDLAPPPPPPLGPSDGDPVGVRGGPYATGVAGGAAAGVEAPAVDASNSRGSPSGSPAPFMGESIPVFVVSYCQDLVAGSPEGRENVASKGSTPSSKETANACSNSGDLLKLILKRIYFGPGKAPSRIGGGGGKAQGVPDGGTGVATFSMLKPKGAEGTGGAPRGAKESAEGAGGGKDGGQERLELELDFEFAQAVHDVLVGVYPTSDVQALQLACLQLRCQLATSPSDVSTQFSVSEFRELPIVGYIPRAHLAGPTGAQVAATWQGEISQLLETSWDQRPVGEAGGSGGLSAPPRVDHRLTYLRCLQASCPLYGATWFLAKKALSEQGLPSEVQIGVGPSSVFFAHAATKEVLKSVLFTEICSWGHSPTSFSIVTGNM
eukprot:jgi/Mesvir1/15624/Mv03231-RA.1